MIKLEYFEYTINNHMPTFRLICDICEAITYLPAIYPEDFAEVPKYRKEFEERHKHDKV